MASLKASHQSLIDEARRERDQMLKDAITVANNIKDQAKADTEKITSKMMTDAKMAIENEKRAAITELKNQTAQLSLQIAEKLLRKKLSDDQAQRDLVSDFVDDINLN